MSGVFVIKTKFFLHCNEVVPHAKQIFGLKLNQSASY